MLPTRFRTRHLPALLALAALAATSLLPAPGWAWFDVPESARGEDVVHEGKPRVDTRLIAGAERVTPGDSFRVGVAFDLDDDWHIYWQNPGEAGLPTEIDWRADQLEFGPLKWAAPHRFAQPGTDLTVFGYADRVILYSTATVAEDAEGSIELSAKVDYLACSSACMPGAARLQREIPVGTSSVASETEILSALDAADARVPRPAADYGLEVDVVYSKTAIRPDDSFEAALSVVACEGAEEQCTGWQPVWENRTHAFVADRTSRADVTVESVRAHPDASTGWVYELSGNVRESSEATKDLLSGVLRFRNGSDTSVPVYVKQTLPVAGPAEEIAERDDPLLDPATATVEPASIASTSAEGAGATAPNIWWILLLAFAGGMILNLMPCVFPVLALKVTSFTRVVQESKTGILSHGAAYTAGIVGSMLALAGAVIGLRMAGHEVGWGFQFQQPIFPALLAGVVTLFALNLFGLFDVGVQAEGLSSSTREASGMSRSFGEGVLAVVLATPCSAPFLGTAVGFAFASSSWTILAVFTSLGLGLAAPFVVLTLVPGWAELLPDPGPWMGHLKHVLGFALAGTAVWLLWLVGRQAGVDAMARVLGLLVVVGLGAWVYGLVQYDQSRLRKWAATAVTLVALAGAGSWVVPLESDARAASASSAVGESGPIDWERWSPDAVDRHLEEGRPVFVDFTADWCLTCKVNEENAITAASAVRAARKHDVAMLKADWTDGSERIRRELQRHGKAGVPLYLVYTPHTPNDPRILPEILTADELERAYARAAGDEHE